MKKFATTALVTALLVSSALPVSAQSYVVQNGDM